MEFRADHPILQISSEIDATLQAPIINADQDVNVLSELPSTAFNCMCISQSDCGQKPVGQFFCILLFTHRPPDRLQTRLLCLTGQTNPTA